MHIDGLRKLPGGASRQTWSLDAVYRVDDADIRLPLVLRRDPGSSTLNTQRSPRSFASRKRPTPQVPVPRPYWVAADAAVLGSPSYLMERVDGETLPRRLLRDDLYAPARGVMLGQLAAILASIHRIDVVRHELRLSSAPPAGSRRPLPSSTATSRSSAALHRSRIRRSSWGFVGCARREAERTPRWCMATIGSAT